MNSQIETPHHILHADLMPFYVLRSTSCSTWCAASCHRRRGCICFPLPRQGFQGAQGCADGERASSVRTSPCRARFQALARQLVDAAVEVVEFALLVGQISMTAFADVAGRLWARPMPRRSSTASSRTLAFRSQIMARRRLAEIASQMAKPDGLVVLDPDATGIPSAPARRADVDQPFARRVWPDWRVTLGGWQGHRDRRSSSCSVPQRAQKLAALRHGISNPRRSG